MRNFKKFIAGFIAMLSLMVINPTQANAAWKQDSTGWWYTSGSSYLTGWQSIDGNWYYFYSNGYMAHDCWIGDYYLNSYGAWTLDVPSQTTTTNYNNGVATQNNKSQTVYITATGKKYHSIPKCGNTKSSRAATLEEAQSLGLGACSKCY